ncbi:MAG: sugar phosphate isomerase/epimerase, partial [Planctomycetaceae bacterium]|nr:sugar phosphate isomerase/epimerase [Planctomycetaceae bacterium]
FSPWGNVKNDLSPANIGQRAGELVQVSAEYGLGIAGLATNMAADELDDVRSVAEACAEHGIPCFRLGAPRRYRAEENYRQLIDDTIKSFEKALEITRPLKVKCILEIHRGTVACSASQAYLVVKNFDPDYLGVIFDIANMSLGEGYEPVTMGLDLLGPYVAHVHAGGGRPVEGERREDGQLTWKWETCDLADSMIDVPHFLAALRARGYNRFVSIEDFRPQPVEDKLGRQLGFLRAALG